MKAECRFQYWQRQVISVLPAYFIHTSPRVLQQFLNPSNMTSVIIFITRVAPMLRVLLGFQFIHTQNKMSLFNEAKWPVSRGKTSQAQHILQHLMSATQVFISSLNCYLCKTPLPDTIGESSPLQVSDKRS